MPEAEKTKKPKDRPFQTSQDLRDRADELGEIAEKIVDFAGEIDRLELPGAEIGSLKNANTAVDYLEGFLAACLLGIRRAKKKKKAAGGKSAEPIARNDPKPRRKEKT